jgi:glycosyltransferase involved in cell wall biosynthesis
LTPGRGNGGSLRILHVVGDLDLGGVETLLYRLVCHGSEGFEHEVICLGHPGWYSSRLRECGVPVHHIGMGSPLTAIRAVATLRRLLRESRADVVQTWMYVSNLLVSWLVRRRRTPVVWAIHNSSFDRLGFASRFSAYAGGRAVRRLANVIVNCSQHSSELHGKLGYSAVPNVVIPNGYDPSDFQPDPSARAAVRHALGLHDGMLVIGSITRWHSHKDVPTLLRAARIASDAGVPLRWLLVGRGLDHGNVELAAEIRKNGCGQAVTALGERSDIQDLACAFDLHVLSSRSEAFPNVVAETMLSATPNVVTDVGDSALIVGATGWVVPPADPDRLAAAVVDAWRESATQPEQWTKRREDARRRIAEEFTFPKMADAYARVWREAAAGGSRSLA